MKAEEKAVDLFSTYRFALSVEGAPLGEQKDSIAKQCALICVNEYLEHLEETRDSVCHMGKSIAYWLDVKDEINKL